MFPTEARMAEFLHARAQAGNLRTLKVKSGLVDFSSNDYLGLAQNQELALLIEHEYRSMYPQKNGSTGSRLLSGNSELAMGLERELATLFRAESTLLFNSGYDANLGLIASVAQKGDTIIYDALVHASMREGYRLSLAHHVSFRHNDVDDLRQKISQAKGHVFVLIESVYSMDGDNGQLEAIVSLCKESGAHLILDEAHSTGLYGENGSGLACSKGLEQDIFARVYTFGKAIGAHGACVAGSKKLIDYLVNVGRSFIYTTALPAHALISIRSSFRYIAGHPELQHRISDLVGFAYKTFGEFFPEHRIKSLTAIQGIMVPGNEACKRASAYLEEKGFDARPILSPTVPAHEERLRVTIHTFNTEEEILQMARHLAHHTQQ